MIAPKRTRNWVVVINNWGEHTHHALSTIPGIRYLIAGKELAPTTGTPHLQCTLVWEEAKTMSATCKALLPVGHPHVEYCMDVFASIEYCKKDGDWDDMGTPPVHQEDRGIGERKRWAEALESAKQGRFEDICPQIQISHIRNLEYIHMRELAATHLPDTEDKHFWYWGSTGTGKSRKAREENPGAYLKLCNKWWDHYLGEDVVIIEDFDKSHGVLGHHLKIWADRYPFMGEIKGGTRRLRPKKIIVTSNYHPSEIWTDDSTLEPLYRRFQITHFAGMPQMSPLVWTPTF